MGMDKGKAKAKAGAKKVGSMVSGKPGIVSTLEMEHEEVATLMDAVADEETSDDKRIELWGLIRKKLIVHAKGEELEVYAECRQHPDLRTLADESKEDHDEIERLIVALDRTSINSAEWPSTFENLKTLVESHVEFEEGEMFPKMQRTLEDNQLDAMHSEYKERKQSLESRVEELEPLTTR